VTTIKLTEKSVARLQDVATAISDIEAFNDLSAHSAKPKNGRPARLRRQSELGSGYASLIVVRVGARQKVQ
jgi:hypothetical protein